MFPFTSTTSPPASLAIRKAPDVRECQCGIHTAEAASALRSRKTERAAKGKPAQPHNFFSSCRAPRARPIRAACWSPNPAPRTELRFYGRFFGYSAVHAANTTSLPRHTAAGPENRTLAKSKVNIRQRPFFSRVEEKRVLTQSAAPFPLPAHRTGRADSRIRLSDWFHFKADGRDPTWTWRSLSTPSSPKTMSSEKYVAPRDFTLWRLRRKCLTRSST